MRLESHCNTMSDLDTFFAKKDKRKKGGKGYSKANTEVIAKNLEEVEKKELKAQEKEINVETIETITSPLKRLVSEDDEWNDYREKVKDYSVLKIESVRLVSTDTEEPVPEQDELKEEPLEADEKDVFDDVVIGGKDDIVIKTTDDDSENINKSAKSDDDKSAKDDDISREDDAKTPTPQDTEDDKGKSTYVPPHLRISQPPKELNVIKPKSRRGKKAAPDINSEEYFPSLGVEEQGRQPSPVPSISPDSALRGAWEKKLEI